MTSTRRNFLRGLTALTAGSLSACKLSGSQLSDSASLQRAGASALGGLGGTYLDNASHHPMTRHAARAIQDYVGGLSQGHSASVSDEVRSKFARLINADDDEITYAPSTSLGENLVCSALGLPHRGGRIVTDALHFIGSFYLYEQLSKQGMDLVILPVQEDGSIAFSDYEAAVDDNTALIAVSHVSWVNGFEHDLQKLAELAHSHGARLYADIIQSAGNTPIDVKAMGVDFACSATYKWLMGDFGLAFLYVNKNLVSELQRPWFGYLQTQNFVTPETRLYPFDPAGEPAYRSAPREGVAGIFNGAFPPRMIETGVNVSLGSLLDTGIDTLRDYRQPMIDALQSGLRERGFRPYTPLGSTSPIVSFIYQNAQSLNDRLTAANVTISTYNDRFRISPSFFNDMNDIDRVIEALGRA